MDTSLESFINFCDEMMITEESITSFKNTIADFFDAFIRKAKNIINNMILMFKKFKKYEVPNEVRKNIVKVRSSCDTLWFKLISEKENPNTDYTYLLDNIKTSKEYVNLFLKNESYSDEEYLCVPVNAVVTDLQKLNTTLSNTEIAYNKVKRRDPNVNNSYWNAIISVLQISINVLNKYFTSGKAQTSNENIIVDMPEFEVKFIDT